MAEPPASTALYGNGSKTPRPMSSPRSARLSSGGFVGGGPFFISLFLYFFISSFLHFFISLFIYFFVSLFLCFFVSLFLYFFVSLFLCFSVSLFLYFFISLFLYFFLYLCLSFFSLSFFLFLFLRISFFHSFSPYLLSYPGANRGLRFVDIKEIRNGYKTRPKPMRMDPPLSPPQVGTKRHSETAHERPRQKKGSAAVRMPGPTGTCPMASSYPGTSGTTPVADNTR